MNDIVSEFHAMAMICEILKLQVSTEDAYFREVGSSVMRVYRIFN